MSEQPQQRAI
jgi:hypothetical protein